MALALNGVFTPSVNYRETFIHALPYLLSNVSEVSDTDPVVVLLANGSALQDRNVVYYELQMHC